VIAAGKCRRVSSISFSPVRTAPRKIIIFTPSSEAQLNPFALHPGHLSSKPPKNTSCLSFDGKRQCWVLQPLVVQDIPLGTSLLAFTHESGRCDVFDDRFPRCAGTIKAKARSVATITMISDINPHDVAV
jgi:hypothetical protein